MRRALLETITTVFDGSDRPISTDANDRSPPIRTDGGRATESPAETATEPAPRPIDRLSLDVHEVFHLLKAPLFVLDADGEVLVWNAGMEELTGSSEAVAMAAEQASQAWYHDGRRSMLLADKIIESPERTQEAYDVERLDGFDFPIYQDSSTFEDATGETRYCTFSAAPLYENGEFVGVVEFVEDRTTDVKRQQELRDLVDELTETMARFEAGTLTARAEVPAVEHVDEELCEVVHAFNRMGERLQGIVADIEGKTETLQTSAHTVANKSQAITENTAEQRTALKDVSAELNTMSATTEEIAASTDQVASAAERTASLAAEGSDVADEANAAMGAVSEAGTALDEDVTDLKGNIEEIDAVVDMIHTIADQTNLLALNASIEAAHTSDGSGDGFAVVAAEVKSLAEDTQERVGEIETMVATIHQQTQQAASSLDEMDEEVTRSREQVLDLIERLEAIDGQTTETAEGIEEVAHAADEQAASAEAISSTAEQVTVGADEMAAQASDVSEANHDHERLVSEIRATIGRLTGEQ